MNPVKAVILDRDGTLIEHIHYLCKPEDVKLLDGVSSGLKSMKECGFKLFLHTNQSGVARNYFGIKEVYACNRRMEKLIGLDSDLFDRICIAIEKPGDPISYRKPSPKFAMEIMKDFGLKPSEICYIGDRLSDIEIAVKIGSRAIGVDTGLVDLESELKESGLLGQFPVYKNFTDAVKYLFSIR